MLLSLKEIFGVEEDEGFYLKDSFLEAFRTNSSGKALHYFSGHCNLYCISESGTPIKINDSIPRILSGEYAIIPAPFRPNHTEHYTFINCDGVINETRHTKCSFDFTNIAMGNCFKDKTQITQEDYDRIKDMFKSAGADVSDWPR